MGACNVETISGGLRHSDGACGLYDRTGGKWCTRQGRLQSERKGDNWFGVSAFGRDLSAQRWQRGQADDRLGPAKIVEKTGGLGNIGPDGPLVIANGYGVFVFDASEGSQGKRLAQTLTRNDPDSGFVQMTAWSHAGPALACLAALSELGYDRTPALIKALAEPVEIARKAQEQSRGRVAQMDGPSWQGYSTQTDQMMTCSLWIVGDYPYTKPENIGEFMIRSKNSLINKTELLSKAVGFWVPGAYRDAGWDPLRMPIPGLTTGFPNGLEAYLAK